MDINPLVPGAAGVFGGGFVLFFILVSVLIAAGFVTVITLIVVNMRRVRARGYNPLTLQADLTTGLLNSQTLAPRQTKTARLAELDQLLADGAITTSEHATSRARILST